MSAQGGGAADESSPQMVTVTLPVRRRTVLSPDGRLSQSVVFCPFSGETKDMAHCQRCNYCDGLEIDSGDWDTMLRCTRPAEDIQPADAAQPSVIWWTPSESAQSGRGAKTPVGEAMRREVISVTQDLPLSELLTTLLEYGYGGAPVVDSRGRPLGIVSKTDLLSLHDEHDDHLDLDHLEGTTVADVMTPFAYTFPESAPISQAAAFMAFKRVHRLPIVSATGELVGMVSSLDILRWLGDNDGYRVPDQLVRRPGRRRG